MTKSKTRAERNIVNMNVRELEAEVKRLRSVNADLNAQVNILTERNCQMTEEYGDMERQLVDNRKVIKSFETINESQSRLIRLITELTERHLGLEKWES